MVEIMLPSCPFIIIVGLATSAEGPLIGSVLEIRFFHRMVPLKSYSQGLPLGVILLRLYVRISFCVYYFSVLGNRGEGEKSHCVNFRVFLRERSLTTFGCYVEEGLYIGLFVLIPYED